MPPNKAPSVKQGTHWWAYKEGDKCCLQRLRGHKLPQLAQELMPARAPGLTVWEPPSVPVARISPGLGGASGRCIRQAELGAPPVLPPSQTLRKRDPGPQSPSKMEGVHSLPRATRIKCHELGGLKGQEFTLMGVEAEDFKGWWPGCTPSTGPGGEAVLASPASTAPSCP